MLRGSSSIAVLACGIAVLSASSVRAATPSITWDAPAECPSEGEVRLQIAEALGDQENGDAIGHVHARVRATEDHRWELAVTFAATRGAERRLVLDSCAAAMRATVFIVAIMVDPQAAESDFPPEPDEPRVPAPVPPVPARPNAPVATIQRPPTCPRCRLSSSARRALRRSAPRHRAALAQSCTRAERCRSARFRQ